MFILIRPPGNVLQGDPKKCAVFVVLKVVNILMAISIFGKFSNSMAVLGSVGD